MNLKDEPYLVEVIKDQVCYVAQDARAEMAKCFPKKKSTVSLEVLLPDGVQNIMGVVQNPRDPRCAALPTPVAPPSVSPHCMDSLPHYRRSTIRRFYVL